MAESEFEMQVNEEGRIALLRSNLVDRYKDLFCIIQELMQNADDAMSRHVHFGISDGMDIDHPLGRLPALYIVNDGPVSRSNMKAIFSIASGDKGNEKGKIGKFGLGMKSVFHVCEGFFMFGDGHAADVPFPQFCTPWTERYHEDWFCDLGNKRQLMAAEVSRRIGDVVKDWERWFCVWLPLRSPEMHDGAKRTKPIIAAYPTLADMDALMEPKNVLSAVRMLPMMRHVEDVSFADRSNPAVRYHLNASARLCGNGGRFSGRIDAQGAEWLAYGGVEEKASDGEFSWLKSLPCWPRYTRFVESGEERGLTEFPDKTDSHVAICILKEKSDKPTLTVCPCAFLPLSGVRENPWQYSVPIPQKKGGRTGKDADERKPESVTLYLHADLFVDAGRQNFEANGVLGRNPKDETELRATWNQALYERALLPLFVPELFSAIQSWTDETADAVMRGLPQIPFVRQWKKCICRDEGIGKELTPDGFKWAKIGANDEVYAIDPPRSPLVAKVIVGSLPQGVHVINGSEGFLLKDGMVKNGIVKVKDGIVKNEFSPELCKEFLATIANMPLEESDNKILQEFAQSCAERLDFNALSELIRKAKIWKIGDRNRYSYEDLQSHLGDHRLYCHAEGGLHKAFNEAVDFVTIQVFESTARALKLDIPDFSLELVVDILQTCPKLADGAARRRPLLERLLRDNKIRQDDERNESCKTDRWRKACRYLVHGSPQLFESDEPLLMPIEGEHYDFSSRLIKAVAAHRHGACCRIERELSAVLNRNDQNALNLPLSSAEDIIKAAAEIRDFPKDGFSPADWRSLVMMAGNFFDSDELRSAIKRLPLFPMEGGQLTALTGDVFREDDDEKSLRVHLAVRKYVRILATEGVEKDSQLARRMNRLVTAYGANDCIRICCEHEGEIGKDEFVSAVIEALGKGGNVTEAGKDRLRGIEWVRLNDGRTVAPNAILDLPEVSGMVPGCDTVEEVADEQVRKSIRESGLVNDRRESIDILFDRMANQERFALGTLASVCPDLDDLMSLFTENSDETLPAMRVMRKLKMPKFFTVFDGLSRNLLKLFKPLAAETLIAVIAILTNRLGGNGSKDEKTELVWDYLLAYLDEAAKRNDFRSAILPCCRFLNRKRQVKGGDDICIEVTGIADEYVLNDRYKGKGEGEGAFWKAIHEVGMDCRVSREREVYLRGGLPEYFRDWPNDFDERIGGFMICCTDQTNEIEIVRRRYGFGSRSIAETRNSLSPHLNGTLQLQHCYVLATPEKSIEVVAITGKKMSVCVTPLSGALDLLYGQFNQLDWVKNTALKVSMGNPPQPDDARSLILHLRQLGKSDFEQVPAAKLDELLKRTLSRIIHAYNCTGSDVDAFWKSLNNGEQLDVRVTRAWILKSLHMYIQQIGCRNQRLKDALKECQNLFCGEEQARRNGNAAEANRYRQRCDALDRELEQQIASDEALQKDVLNALREKVGEFSYNCDSVLFELFQNADDAYEEMAKMCAAARSHCELLNRFDVRFDGKTLVVAHWGRPINQYRVPGVESEGKFNGYKFDLQRMILLSQSGKDVDGVQTQGRYGIGFKSVFLVCDTPVVKSGKLCFKIVGGLLPEFLDEHDQSYISGAIREAEGIPSSIKPTVYVLPVREDRRREVADAIRHFANEAGVLGLFARRIRHISVYDATTGKHTEVHADEPTQNEVVFQHCGANGEFLRIDVPDATLLLGAKDGLPAPLPEEVATYWALCPTGIKANLGVALNANLKLDTGRQCLDPKSKKNDTVLLEVADRLYAELKRGIETLPESVRGEWLTALFRVLTGGKGFRNWDDRNGAHQNAHALFSVLWGERGAYRRVLDECAAVPSGLLAPSPYSGFCRLPDVEWMVDPDVVKSGLLEAIESPSLEDGKVVAKERFMEVGNVFFPDRIRDIATYNLQQLLHDLLERQHVLTAKWCNDGNAKRLHKLVEDEKDNESIQKAMREFKFEAADGGSRSPSELLIGKDEEELRANFAPSAYVLSGEYDADGVVLARLFRCGKRLSDERLAEFALNAADEKRQLAVLTFIVEGNPSSAFCKTLKVGRHGTWLDDWKSCHAAQALGFREKTKIADALSDGDDDFLREIDQIAPSGTFGVGGIELPPPPPPKELPPLADVAEWWHKNREAQERSYNYEAYGRYDVEPLTFDLEMEKSRSLWLEVLVLGAAHRIGFGLCQHKGFVQRLKSNKWWNVYCRKNVDFKEWMETLDSFLEREEMSGGEYGYWFRLFPRIYQFARHLDTYVRLFESLNNAGEIEKCDLTAIATNPRLSGSGIDAPGLQYALGGSTGLSFVCREMVRRGAIRNPALHRFCFVPYPKVSEFGECLCDSEAIYRRAVRELGLDGATFGKSFDIALTSYMKWH